MRGANFLIVFSLLLIKTRAEDPEVDPLCAGLPPDVEVLFPSPVTCEEYFKCFNGIFSVEMCPQGLVFSDKLQDCVPPEYSECTGGTGLPTSSSTAAPSTPPTTTQIPTDSTVPTASTTPDDDVDPRCLDNGTSYWPHPSDCNKYIECYQGDSYEMECPPGTYFSENRKKCGNANESECCLSNIAQCP